MSTKVPQESISDHHSSVYIIGSSTEDLHDRSTTSTGSTSGRARKLEETIARIFSILCIFSFFVLGLNPLSAKAASQVRSLNADNITPPSSAVKLIFIHHSVGGYLLADWHGELGLRLMENNYFVSDVYRGWVSGGTTIGDYTDIPHWWDWFRSSKSATYTQDLYTEYGQTSTYGSYTRLGLDPGGENEVIIFKSCFTIPDIRGTPTDPPTPNASNPLIGEGSSYYTGDLTVGNAKGVYLDLLDYFATRQDKLFILFTTPAEIADATDDSVNMRALNNWLVNDWLDNYPYQNVAVFDFYNVLTSNGGNANTNDLGSSTGNHHRWWDGAEQHLQTLDESHQLYPSEPGNSHPSVAGNHKAGAEFVSLLNVFYHRWKDGGSTSTATPTSTATSAQMPTQTSTGIATSTRTQTPVSTSTRTATPTRTLTATSSPLEAGTYDDTDGRILYSGTWTLYSGSLSNGSTFHHTSIIDNSVRVSFRGTQVGFSYIGQPTLGVMNVFIDGQLVASVNEYNPTVIFGKLWMSSPLAYGEHVMLLVNSSNNPVDIDTVQVVGSGTPTNTATPTQTSTRTQTPGSTFTRTASPTRTSTAASAPLEAGTYDDTDQRLLYSGTWTLYSGPLSNGSTFHHTSIIDNSVRVSFKGTQVGFTFIGQPTLGVMNVFIDGQLVASVNEYNPTVIFGKLWMSSPLVYGEHVMLLVNSSNNPVDIDTVQVVGSGTPTPTP